MSTNPPLVVAPNGSETFLNAPLVTELAALDAEVAILGVPHGVPYNMRGVAGGASDAPAAIRHQSLRFGHGRFIGHYDFDFDDGDTLGGRPLRIVDCGDVTADPLDIPGNAARATEAVRSIIARGVLPVILGGDDSIPIPFFRAFDGHGPLTLIQIDAHLDYRDEIDGVHEGFSSPIRRASEMPWIERIVQLGMRGVGSARQRDVNDARANGNLIVRAPELREAGVASVLDRIPAGPYLITIDADGLDPSVAPGVGAPAPGGLTFDETTSLLRGLAGKGRIAGLDVVEIVPALDRNNITSLVAFQLIMTTLGAAVRAGQFG
ncbi:MAG TPA: agmatinase [Thermomicrobiales bacterium]|nr:agmatinase [Thermomicrobiales bacterium]